MVQNDSLFSIKERGRRAPTKEIMSLKTYSALRKMNMLRKQALQLFQVSGKNVTRCCDTMT